MKRAAAWLAVPAVLLALLLPMFLAAPPPSQSGPAGCSPAGGAPQVVPASDVPGGEQETNAATIVAVGQQMGVPPQGWVIAVMTAIQESGLKNINYGLGSSQGLFQQLDAWGPAADRTDPAKAAAMFYTGGKAGQPGLLDIRGWQSMELWEASHAVQRSAFPTAVRKHEPVARDLVAKVAGQVAVEPAVLQEVCPAPGSVAPAPGASGTGACPLTRFVAVEAGLQQTTRRGLQCAAEAWPQIQSVIGKAGRGNKSYHPRGEAIDLMIPGWQDPGGVTLGNQVADWAVANAAALGIKEVIWNDRIWSSGRQAWKAYTHPSGATDANSAHRNHVHLSIPQTAASAPI